MSLIMKLTHCFDKQQHNRLASRNVNRIRKILLTLSMVIFLQTAVHAADKIRIGYPDFNSSTFTLPLAQMRGFFQEEGPGSGADQGSIRCCHSGVDERRN